MKINKQSLSVFEGEAYETTVDGKPLTEHYSYVFFYLQEINYRHFKTFNTYKEAYSFMLKMFLSADLHGMVTINEKHWGYVENEIREDIA